MGLLLTDTKLWSTLNEKLRDRAYDANHAIRTRYEDTTDRLQDASDALRGRSSWISSTASFLGGVGLGVGLGILFAPVSGEDARAAIRDSAVDVKNRVGAMATGSCDFALPALKEIRSSAAKLHLRRTVPTDMAPSE